MLHKYSAFPIYLLMLCCYLAVSGCSKFNISPLKTQTYGVSNFEKNAFYPSEKTKVGVLVPLTGKNQSIGQSLYEAAQLAVHENQYHDISLYPIDSNSANAIETIKSQQIQVVVGPLFASDVQSFYPSLMELGVPMLTLSNDEALKDRKGVMLIGIPLAAQLEQIIKHAKAQAYTNFFVLVPEGKFGDSVVNIVQASNIKVIKTFHYSAHANNAVFTDIIKELQGMMEPGKKYGIIFPEDGHALQNFTRAASLTMGEDNVVLFGSSQWANFDDNNSIIKELSLPGYYPSIDNKKASGFVDRFEQSFGYKPSIISSLGYDGMVMAEQMIRELKLKNYAYIDPTVLYGKYLTKPITGPITISAQGEVTHNLMVYKVHD